MPIDEREHILAVRPRELEVAQRFRPSGRANPRQGGTDSGAPLWRHACAGGDLPEPGREPGVVEGLGEVVVRPKGAGPAVVVLDAPVSDVLPFSLPQAGMPDAKNVRSEPFTNVGYGYADRTFSFDGYRRSATSAFTTLKATELQLSDKPGGVCFGDSGGPRLLGSVEVAVTSNGNANCPGQSTSYRLDTPSARAFLSGFLAVP